MPCDAMVHAWQARRPRQGSRHLLKFRLALLATGSLLLVGCALGLLYPAPAQIRMAVHFVDAKKPTRCLIVFFPGFGDNENTFDKHGFLDALEEHHMAVDSVTPDITFGYYSRHNVAATIHDDILGPIAARPYKQIWLVGVSMGGFGALLVARDPRSHIAGMFLMAPFLGDLGDHDLLSEIDHAGGLKQWSGDPGQTGNDQRDAWRYLKEITAHPDGPPVLFLGGGEKDPLSFSHRLLRDALPEKRVYETQGGHDWGPWAVLWDRFLNESDFRARCAP
jgi:pimeloyl-ACP methyl ester carboxylesterase